MGILQPHSDGWGKIKCLKTKFAISQKCGLPCVGSHVWEIPEAETETAERNRPETKLQTIWNNLRDETIYNRCTYNAHIVK